MKNIIYLLTLVVLFSCASNGVRLSEKEKKQYKEVKYIYFNGEPGLLYTKKRNEQNFHFHNANTRIKTNITSFIRGAWQGRNFGYNNKSKNLYVHDKNAALGIRFVVKNFGIYKDFNGKKKFYILKNGNSYLMGVSKNDGDYFQYLSDKNKLSPWFKAKFLNINLPVFHDDSRIPYVTLENGLVYPVLFDGNTLKLKPDNTGFQGFELKGRNAGHAVYIGDNNEKIYTRNHFVDRKRLFRGYDDKSEVKISRLIEDINSEVINNGFTIIERDKQISLAAVNSVEPYVVDFIRSYKTKKYSFSHLGIGKYTSDRRFLYIKEFDTKEAAYKALRHNNLRVVSILESHAKQKEYKAKMDKYMEDNKEVFAARRRAREKKQADLNYRSAQAAKNNKNRARFSDIDLTGGVDVEASKARSKCIQKRTATKKAFISGKQGWYSTGGCK